jgi:PAS domain S-box-containing protein
MPASPRQLPRLRRAVAATPWPVAFAALVAAALALVGWGAHTFQVAQIRRGAAERLTMVAELKRDQVEGWIAAQRRLALAVSRGTTMADALDRQLGAGGISDASGARWLPRLRTVQDLGGFADVSLLRLDGSLVLSSREGPLPEPPDPAVVAEALRTGEPALSTVRREPALEEGALSMDLVAPVLVDGAGGRRAIGLLRLRIDPRAVLYPMLQAWPTGSDTAEIVLAQASADEVVFLSEVRHRSHVALALRVPRSARERLIIQAATGARGLLEGVDYRGVPVLGAARTLAGTSWLLVAKEDEAELFAPLWRRTLWTTAAAATLLAALALVLRSWLGQRAAKGLTESRLMLEAVLDAIPARVFWKDRELRFLGCNRALARDAGLTGPEALVGRRDEDMPWARQAEAYQADDRAVLASGQASLGVEEEFTTAEGRTVWVRRSKVPLRGPDGEIRGLLGTFEDLTPQKQAEAAAHAGQARVRAVLDNAGFGISITDREGRMLESNPEWARFLGYTLEELEPLRIQELTHPDDREASRRNLEGVYTGAIASYTQEKRYLRKDGEVVWGLLAVTPIRDAAGRVESVVGIVADITERKRIETELALVAERLSVATESAGIGIWDWDVKNDVLVWDDAMYRMYGLRREDFGGAYEAWRRAFDPADRQRTDENILAALRGEREFAPEFRVRWPDGSVHHIQAAARILRDGAGRPVRMVGVNFDITARKAAEEQLQQSKHFLEAVTDAVPGLVGYWDRDLRCQFANRQYHEWFGWSPERMRGTHMREVLGEALFARNEPFVRKVLAGEAQRFEQPNGPGGPSRYSWVHYIPDVSEGEVRGFFVLVSDITELKNAQHEAERLNEALRERTRQAEAASRAKSDFLANMSHEIRTPMNAIVGLSHLLQGSELAPKQRDYLARIQGAARSLLAIINDVLDLAKIEANRLEVEQVAFSLSEVFRHVEGLVAEKAREKGLELSCELPPDVPAQLLGDGLRLGQVLLNLLNNAVKFTEHGRVVMTARLVEEQGDAVRLRFSIRDTGIGIPADALPRLFQPFSQADATTTRRFGGTGLGLSISRRLVELMGGELTVQSTPGQGSTFSFVIGLVRRRGESARAPGTVTGKRVLVVDDDPGFRSVAMEILSSMGMVLRTVGSGQEALAALLDSVQHPSQAFDVVLLDWRMPGLDGLETARRIREDLRLREQPVIILTTDLGRELEEREQLEALLDGVLLKPVEPDVFRDVLEEAFRRRQGLGYEPAAPVPLVPGGGRRQGKVLVAEDNETNRLVVTELLRGAGIVVEEALNGREAVQLALRPGAGFDLVLMDVQMPEMDGFEATARIREVQPRLPIVAMTAHAMERERQRALDAGMVDHVAKPFEPAQIWAVLDRWLPVIAPAGAPAAAGPAVVRSTDERFLTALGRDLRVCADRLGTARSAGDAALAAEAAHALKGLALPPASAGVRDRARALEQAVRGGAPWSRMAEELEGELRPMVEAARRAVRPETAPAGNPERASPAELRGLLQQTALKIRRHSLGAKDHVDALRARIGSDRLLRRLEDCLDGVDFTAAEAALKQLAEAMGLEL